MNTFDLQQNIMNLDNAEDRAVFVERNRMPGVECTRLEKNYRAIVNLRSGDVASIVSKDYKIVQHKDVANAFVDACRNLNIPVEGNIETTADGNAMFFDVEVPTKKLAVAVGEEFITGFRVINSYNKTTGVLILPRLVRLACLNGMVIQKGFTESYTIRHTQKLVEKYEGLIEKSLNAAIDSCDKLKALVNGCIEDSKEWESCLKILEHVISTKKHHDKIKEILEETLSKKPEAFGTEVGKTLTRWDVYNAITNYATHGEQLSPLVEMMLQRKAEKVMVTPLAELEAQIPVEVE